MGADDEGEGEGVPVFVGVGWVVAGGGEGCPVFSVVAGDVGAVGAYGDPEFLVGIVGYGGAVAVGWGCWVNLFLVSNEEAVRWSG